MGKVKRQPAWSSVRYGLPYINFLYPVDSLLVLKVILLMRSTLEFVKYFSNIYLVKHWVFFVCFSFF